MCVCVCVCDYLNIYIFIYINTQAVVHMINYPSVGEHKPYNFNSDDDMGLDEGMFLHIFYPPTY